MYRLLSFCALFIFAFSYPSIAQDINEDGAKRLQSVLQRFLNQQKTALQNSHYLTLITEGNVSVEPAGSYYAATLPSVKLSYPNGERIDIGMISINASPGDKEGQWKMAIALPTPMQFYDGDGNAAAHIAIGGQRAAGIWDENLNAFVKYDALYNDIMITGQKNKDALSIKIPQTFARYDFRDSGDNKLSGDGYVSINNMTVGADPQNNGTVGEFRIDFNTKNFDVVAFQKNNARIQALTSGLTTQGADTKALEKEMMSAIVNMYRSFGDSLGLKYAVKDVRISAMDKATKTPRDFALKDAMFGFDVGGFNANKAFLGFEGGFHGLGFDDPKTPKDIVPSDFNIDINFKDLPFNELVDMGTNAVQSVQNNPESKGMVGLSLMMRLPALLSKAGSQATVENTYIGNKDYRFSLNGNIVANIQAVTGMVADMNATFRGLDKLISNLSDYQQSADGKVQSGDMIKQLKFLQGIGDKSGGGDTYLYKFNLKPSGEMTLNGKPAQSVLKGAR